MAAATFVAPLERLGAAAASFAAGSKGVRAEIEGPRETRIIAESFNHMASEVDSAIEELKVEERRKTQFVSDVSHELRTPLTAIRGAAETLLDGDVDPEDQQRFLTTIALEAERLGRLANDLLTLQRIEGATGELPLTQVDLRLAADRAQAMLEPLLEDRDVTLTINGRAPMVLGDVDRLQQVVLNLVDNASRIVGEGGHVVVELTAEGDRAVLSVLDDGPGIPPEDLPRLFDRFYRADTSSTRTSGGAGLGLAIVRAIVTAHGGRIEAANLPVRRCADDRGAPGDRRGTARRLEAHARDPDRRGDRDGDSGLHRIGHHEGHDAHDERLEQTHVGHDRQLKPAQQVDDGDGCGRGRHIRDHLLHPAALERLPNRRPDRRRQSEADDVATGRPEHHAEPRSPCREHRHPGGTHHQVDAERRRGPLPAQEQSREHHAEHLERHRHRPDGQRDPPGGRHERRDQRRRYQVPDTGDRVQGAPRTCRRQA